MQQQPRFFRTLARIVVFVAFVIGLHLLGFLRIVEEPLARLLHIGSEKIYTISVWSNGEYSAKQFSETELQEEFISLQAQYVDTVVDTAILTTLKEENRLLKSQLTFFSEKNWGYVTARITGKNVDPFSSSVTLFIKSAEQRIPLGVPAVTEDGIFVGVVTQVVSDTVIVRLLDDGQTKVGAALLNDKKTIGVVEGGFGKSIRMNFIPQNESIASGNIVVTSGISEHIPYGLPIGTIEAVEKEPYQPFQSAVISPIAQPNSLQILSLIVSVPVSE